MFLPLDEANSTYKTIDLELLKNKKTKEFIENFGIKKPSLKDEINNNIFDYMKKMAKLIPKHTLKSFSLIGKMQGDQKSLFHY